MSNPAGESGSTSSYQPQSSLLPAFSSKQFSHLPTPQSPNDIGRYVNDSAIFPDSPMSNQLSNSQPRSGSQFRRDDNDVPTPSSFKQYMTPESSPHPASSSSFHHLEITPRYNSSSMELATPKRRTSADPPLPNPTSSNSPPRYPNTPSVLSSPFMAKETIPSRQPSPSRRSPKPSTEPAFTLPPPQIRALTPPKQLTDSQPLPEPERKGGEIDRIRQSMLEDRIAYMREAEKHRPDYLKRQKRNIAEMDTNELEQEIVAQDDYSALVGIMESPQKGRRLKLFQETSEESFEESLMAGGYGRYRTADWVRQPQPLALSASILATPLNLESPPEKAVKEPPSEKELLKRKRLAAFQTQEKQFKSNLAAIELEGKGRVLVDLSVDEHQRQPTPEPSPTKKRATARRKKKGVDNAAEKQATQVPVATQVVAEKPNWLDSEFPWRLRTEERAELAKAEQEERLKWIERFLDRDSDDEDEEDTASSLAEDASSQARSNFFGGGRKSFGRGKRIPTPAYPEYNPNVLPYTSDPGDARAALLSKKRVRTLAYRQQRRRSKNDGSDDDDEVVCICMGRDDGRELVQCDACETWYHLECIGIRDISELGKEEDPWFCRRCVSRSRSPSTEPDIMPLTEPTFVPTDEDPAFNRSSKAPLRSYSSTQTSPHWSVLQTPKTPTRTRTSLQPGGSFSAWIDYNRTDPSTPKLTSATPSNPNSDYRYVNPSDTPTFDPTSTPSRGVTLHYAGSLDSKEHWSRSNIFRTPLHNKPLSKKGSHSMDFHTSLHDSANAFGAPHMLGQFDESPVHRSRVPPEEYRSARVIAHRYSDMPQEPESPIVRLSSSKSGQYSSNLR